MQLRSGYREVRWHKNQAIYWLGMNSVNNPPLPPSKEPMEALLPGPLFLDAAPLPGAVEHVVVLADGEPDDAELVRRCQAGRTEAYEKLVVRYRGRIYAMIMNI